MRYLLWLASGVFLYTVLLLSVAACDDNGSDGDADGDGDVWIDPYNGCGEVGKNCNMSPECPDGQVCVGHTCDCAYDRFYKVEITTAAIYARTSTGNCWDGTAPDCVDPDPYAVVKVDDASHRTATDTDTTNPMWSESFEAFIHHPNPDATEYWVSIFDDDSDEGDEDDSIMEFPPSGSSFGYPIYEDTLRQGGITVKQGTDKQRTVIKLILSPLPNE